MSQLILMIAKIDDLDNPETLTELWRQSMPMVSLSDITQAHYLNELESQVQDALNILEEYRPQAKNIEKLDEMINCLRPDRPTPPTITDV